MNTTYIAQCAAAKELRESWLIQDGDMYYDEGGAWAGPGYASQCGQVLRVDNASRFLNSPYFSKNRAVPLWSQEQLWAMLPIQEKYIFYCYRKENRGWEISFQHKSTKGRKYFWGDSVEEVLFQAIMFLNHNKTWNSAKGAWV